MNPRTLRANRGAGKISVSCFRLKYELKDLLNIEGIYQNPIRMLAFRRNFDVMRSLQFWGHLSKPIFGVFAILSTPITAEKSALFDGGKFRCDIWWLNSQLPD